MPTKDCRELSIDPEFRDLCGTLQPDERARLENSILEYGCRDDIVVWANHEDTIIDGHNRYDICLQNDMPFKVKALRFESRADVLEWIRNEQLGRRNLTDTKRAYLIGLDYKAKKNPTGKPESNLDTMSKLAPQQEIAEKHGITERTVRRNEKFSEAVDAAAEAAGPEIKSAVLTEKVKSSTAALNDLTALPEKAQKAAVDAIKTGKAKSVKQAVKQAKGAFSIVDPPAKSNGKPVVDVRKFDAAKANLGKLIREFTALNEHAPCKFRNQMQEPLNALVEILEAWRKAVVK